MIPPYLIYQIYLSFLEQILDICILKSIQGNTLQNAVLPCFYIKVYFKSVNSIHIIKKYILLCHYPHNNLEKCNFLFSGFFFKKPFTNRNSKRRVWIVLGIQGVGFVSTTDRYSRLCDGRMAGSWTLLWWMSENNEIT